MSNESRFHNGGHETHDEIEEELRESRRRLSTLMSNLPGMAYRCLNEPHWPMIFVSEGCEELCGYSSEELVSGEVIWESLLVPDDRQWLWDSVQAAVSERRPFEIEYRIRHRDGSSRWLWEQGRGVFRDGELEALEGFITDVTARKRAEEELREVDRRKDQFLAVLGHELRNPLTAIISASEYLEDHKSEDPVIDRVQRILWRQSRQMKRLIDGLLDVSRITRGKISLDKKRVDLLAVLRGLMEDHSEKLSQRNVEVRIGAGNLHMWVEADPVRLGQVFDNLLMNAIHFTESSDTITIGAERVDDTAEVVIADTGQGIDAELLPVIFEPFQQASPDMARTNGGLGLGLALAKGLVELHGGEIEARSAGEGHGSQFVVRLPLQEAPAPAEPDEAVETQTCRDILLIEDEPDVAEVLTLIISRVGHAVRVASTAQEGLEMARHDRPDLIICDLGLPGVSGYELAEMVRADESLGDIPLVALTGYGGETIRGRALEAGFDEHVTKPVSMDEMAEVCKRVGESAAPLTEGGS